jgi:hypothetical protein
MWYDIDDDVDDRQRREALESLRRLRGDAGFDALAEGPKEPPADVEAR